MKKLTLSLFVLLLSIPAFCQSKAAQIAAIKNQISTLEQGYSPLNDRLNKNDKFGDDIKFAQNAYKTQYDRWKGELDNFNAQQDQVNRGYELLKPSWDNYQQRKTAHNANQCVAHSQGECDWYNREADSIDAQRNQIMQAKAPLDQQQAQLDSQRGNLKTQQDQLTQIWQNNNANVQKWQAEQDSIKSDYLSLKASIDKLNAQLAILYGSVNNCMAEIRASNPECEKPAIDPATGKPILNQNCERMAAACSKMFDGN